MSFIRFALAHGVLINEAKFFASERIKRCPTVEHPKSTNGAYFWDGSRGWAYAWDGDARVHWYDDPNAKPWTEAEKGAWRAKRDAARAGEASEHRRAAERAAEMLRSTAPDRHDYLIRKRLFETQGLVLPTGELLVPMRNPLTNELQGAQIIRWNSEAMKWEKKMLPGMKAKGAVLRLGPDNATETIFCEGYATGLSIEAAVRQMRLHAAVLVCFSDSNMVTVAGMVTRGRRYVFADHDKSGAGERAARETGLPFCMSPTLGDDANDLHARDGLLPLCALLMHVRQQEVVVT